MIKWLKCLFRPCEHHWTMFEKIRIIDDWGEQIGVKYVVKCDKCGWIKGIRP